LLLILCRWSWWLLGPVGGLMLMVGILRALRRGKTLCPGPRRPAWRLLSPLSWVLTRPCGYDLSGLGPGVVRCPECGGAIALSRCRSHAHRLRLIPLGALLLMLSAGAAYQLNPRPPRWGRLLPTTGLILIQRALGPETPRAVRHELELRAHPRSLPRWQLDLLIPARVRELRDDGVRGNGVEALWWLKAAAPACIPALERALRSDDYQQRQLAAYLLRDLLSRPTDDLLRVTVEGLRDDTLTHEPARPGSGDPYGRWSLVANARTGVRYLTDHAAAAQPWLAECMASTDRQQRLLAAAAAAFGGLSDLAPVAVPVLVEHLAHNGIAEDAKLAAPAILAFGAAALPFLEEARLASDAQQAVLARQIIRQIQVRAPQAPRLAAAPRPDIDPRILRGITRFALDPTELHPDDLLSEGVLNLDFGGAR
jgi:hypothetical protein